MGVKIKRWGITVTSGPDCLRRAIQQATAWSHMIVRLCLNIFSDVFSRSNDISKNGYKLGAGKLVIFTSEIYHYYLMLS